MIILWNIGLDTYDFSTEIQDLCHKLTDQDHSEIDKHIVEEAFFSLQIQKKVVALTISVCSIFPL